MSCGAEVGGPPTEGVDLNAATVVEGVVRRNGLPVEGAYVRLLDRAGDFAAEVPTSATGSFRFFAAPGRWTVRTLAPRAESVDQEVVADRGKTARVEVALAERQ